MSGETPNVGIGSARDLAWDSYSDKASVIALLKYLSNLVPLENIGVYEIMFKTATYAGLAANAPLLSWRWTDKTRFMMLLRMRLMVITSVAATVASITERQLIVARKYTVTDTGGALIDTSKDSGKRMTAMPSSLLTDMRAFGGAIVAGTRTLDPNPIGSVAGWSGLLSTGIVIGASSGSPVGAARSTEGGTGMVPIYDALNGQDYPQTFVKDEGAVVRIGAVQPTTTTQETWGTILWAEANRAKRK